MTTAILQWVCCWKCGKKLLRIEGGRGYEIVCRSCKALNTR